MAGAAAPHRGAADAVLGVSGALVVFAKQPLPGQVKTRWRATFMAEQAADFYACMLEDVLETTLRASAALGLVAVLAFYNRPRRRPLLRCAGRPALRAAAGARDLGARMEQRVSARQLAAGHGPVLLRGSDSPTLPLETLVRRAGSLSSAAIS